jgi:hypothetical protein
MEKRSQQNDFAMNLVNLDEHGHRLHLPRYNHSPVTELPILLVLRLLLEGICMQMEELSSHWGASYNRQEGLFNLWQL